MTLHAPIAESTQARVILRRQNMAMLLLTQRAQHPDHHAALGPSMTCNDVRLLRCPFTHFLPVPPVPRVSPTGCSHRRRRRVVATVMRQHRRFAYPRRFVSHDGQPLPKRTFKLLMQDSLCHVLSNDAEDAEDARRTNLCRSACPRISAPSQAVRWSLPGCLCQYSINCPI